MCNFQRQHALWDKFLREWPRTSRATMTLREYTRAGSKDSFTGKATIDRWQWTHVLENRDSSIAKAMKVTANHKTAVGQPEGLAKGPRR